MGSSAATLPKNGSAGVTEGPHDPSNAPPGTALVAPESVVSLSDKERLARAAAGWPVELEVAVPIRDFRLRHLLALQPDTVIESNWSHTEDVPLSAGKVQLAWSEFEVLEQQMAVRLTRLA